VIGALSQCGVCTRFRPPLLWGTDGPTCDAFPAGIPGPVWAGDVDHRRPVDGDGGLRWESNGHSYPRRIDLDLPAPSDVQAAAADPDALRIQQQWDRAKARLLKRWPKLAGPMVDELAGQAEAAEAAGDLALLGELQVSAGVLAAIAVPLRKTGTELAAEAAAGVVAEAAEQGTDVTAPAEPGADRIRQHADAVARIIAAGYASGAAKTGLQLAGAGPQDVRDEIQRHLTELGESVNGLVGENISSLLSAAQFAGRLAILDEYPAVSYTAVEYNDRNRCRPCSAISGKSYPTLRAATADYPGGGSMKRCEGRGRCRGFIRPHW
jgi:hypothetical protein